jgi:N-acetylglucosamine-6-phosphate deacetylase
MRVQASLVVTADAVVERGEVEVEDGRVVSVRALPSSAVGVPARVVCPGFVDLQINGMEDIDCAAASGSDWDRLVALQQATGVTRWCPTLVTAPIGAFASRLDRVLDGMSRHPSIVGAHLEGPFLGGAPGAHPRDLLVPIDIEWLGALPPHVKVVTLAPELEHAAAAIRLLCEKGVLVSLGHSTASYDEAVAGADAGARLVTHLFNGMSPLHHRSPGLLGAALADDRLTPSMIADGVHVDPAALRLAARAKGPGRWVLVTDAVAWRSGRLAERSVGLVDGAPRLPDGTLAGSALTMDAAVRRMVHEAGIATADVLRAASTTPATLLGISPRGVTLLDEMLVVEDVLL